MKAKNLRAALWETIIVRTEALNDVAVLSQARPTAKAAARLATIATEVVTLARAAQLAEPSR